MEHASGAGSHDAVTAEFDGDTWRQIGEYVPKSGDPRKTFEMTLKRIVATFWPSASVVLSATIAGQQG